MSKLLKIFDKLFFLGKMRDCSNTKGLFLEPKKRARLPKISLEEAKEIRRLYDNGGYSYRNLARKFGCSKTTIENIIRGNQRFFQLGMRKAKFSKTPLSEWERDRIHFLNWKGFSSGAIAQQLGRSPQTVSKLIKQMDW